MAAQQTNNNQNKNKQKDEELGNPYDWTEFYWGGFQPSMIGAVPIIDAFSKDQDSIINVILDKTRQKLKAAIKNDEIYSKNEIKFDDYFVTIHDQYEDAENEKGIVNDNDNDNDKDKNKDNKNILTIVRLWHKNVFIGVRGSGKANPGKFNFIISFDAKSGDFKNFEKWE